MEPRFNKPLLNAVLGTTIFVFFTTVIVKYEEKNLDMTKDQGIGKICSLQKKNIYIYIYVLYNEVLLYQGSFPHILLLLGRMI